MTSSGTEPATFRLVTQGLNELKKKEIIHFGVQLIISLLFPDSVAVIF
jgi:hypothetical protein